MIFKDSRTEKRTVSAVFFYFLKLEKLNVANSATSQTEIQSNHEQNYKQKSTTKVPNFRSFQTRKKCNLTNRITIKSQAEMQTDYKQNERKREKERKKQRKNKEIKKDIKRIKEYILYIIIMLLKSRALL